MPPAWPYLYLGVLERSSHEDIISPLAVERIKDFSFQENPTVTWVTEGGIAQLWTGLA